MDKQIFLCEYEFDDDDLDHQGYFMCEMNFYAWIPVDKQSKGIENHMLNVWKNLVTGEYKVVRCVCGDKERNEVIFKSLDFQAALDVVVEHRKLMYDITEQLLVCKHEYPNKSEFCRVHKHEQKMKLIEFPSSLIDDLKKIKDDLVSFSSIEE